MSSETSEGERRIDPRAGIEAEVRLQGEASWAGSYRTANLSSSGAFLVSDSPPPRGSMVKLDLHVDSGKVFRGLEALVVHVRMEASEPSARGCGLMFLRMSTEEAQGLVSLVSDQVELLE